MSSPRCKIPLGNDRYLQISEWKGELRVDLREWQNDYPTKKGISLNTMQFKDLSRGLSEVIDPVLKNEKGENKGATHDERYHLGGGVYVTLTKNNPCVDIRQYWKPPNQNDTVPTKKGLTLRPLEYATLRQH